MRLLNDTEIGSVLTLGGGTVDIPLTTPRSGLVPFFVLGDPRHPATGRRPRRPLIVVTSRLVLGYLGYLGTLGT